MESIFFENKALRFVSARDPHFSGIRHIACETPEALADFAREEFPALPDYTSICVDCGTASLPVFEAFISQFPIIEAGGGLVHTKNPESQQANYLYIFRNRMWDLPKGKKEQGESDEENARREVEEETGLKQLDIRSFIASTYHFCRKPDRTLAIKKSNWFEMEIPRMQEPVPQTEEGITRAVWLPYEEIKTLQPKMYASIAFLTSLFFDDPARLSK